MVGSSRDADLKLKEAQVEERHARLYRVGSSPTATRGSYHIVGLAPGQTFVNGQQLLNGKGTELRAGDILHFGSDTEHSFKIKLRHVSANKPTKLSTKRNLVFR